MEPCSAPLRKGPISVGTRRRHHVRTPSRRRSLHPVARRRWLCPCCSAPPPRPSLRCHLQGPDTVADTAARVMDAVVNISTPQTVAPSRSVPTPNCCPARPSRSSSRNSSSAVSSRARRMAAGRGASPPSAPASPSTSTGFIVTNNHVIADADEIYANFADGTKLKAELVGRDTKVDLRAAQGDAAGRQDAHLAETGDPDVPARRRLGDGDRQPAWPWRHADGRRHLRRATATSIPAPTTISCRPTPPSTAALRRSVNALGLLTSDVDIAGDTILNSANHGIWLIWWCWHNRHNHQRLCYTPQWRIRHL